jgi:hypothetical protein
MEGTGGRRLGWIAIALGGLALFVALSGRMQPSWGRYSGPQGAFGPQAYQAGPRGQLGPDAQVGPQGQFGPRGQFGPWDQAGPRGQFGPREQFEVRKHWGGHRHGFPFFFFPFMLIGGLLKLLFVGLLIWLGLRLIRGGGPGGPWGRGPSNQDPPSKPGPEQPPYTGETQQM